MILFNRRYGAVALLLFLTEVFIALYVRDGFIRPYAGDFLVVIFLYCLLKTFVAISVAAAATSVLLFAFLVEGAQYFNLIGLLGLEHSFLAKMILGNFFHVLDLLCYTLGIACVLLAERARYTKRVVV